MAISRTEFDVLKARVIKLEKKDVANNTDITNLINLTTSMDSRVKKLEGNIPPTNILFQEDFSGFGDYVVPEGGLTKDSKMKNIWGNVKILHDSTGYFARVRSNYNGDGNGVSAMLLTVQNFSNCRVSYKVRTNLLTWTNPLNYHGAWFMQRHSDNNHHYYTYMQRDGDLEVGKKDNLSTDSFPERQVIFGPQPHFAAPILGQWYLDEWTTKNNSDGTVTITFARNGTPFFNYTDSGVGNTDVWHHALTQQLLNGGRIGPYVEDAEADYANIIITAIQ